MKNISLYPELSNEDRKNIWSNLKEGDELVYIEYNHFSYNYIINYHKVIKRTAKGSIRLENGNLLKYFSSNFYLLTDDVKNWIEKVELEKEVRNLLFYVSNDIKYFFQNLEHEDALILKEILDKCVDKK